MPLTLDLVRISGGTLGVTGSIHTSVYFVNGVDDCIITPRLRWLPTPYYRVGSNITAQALQLAAMPRSLVNVRL